MKDGIIRDEIQVLEKGFVDMILDVFIIHHQIVQCLCKRFVKVIRLEGATFTIEFLVAVNCKPDVYDVINPSTISVMSVGLDFEVISINSNI